jgi:hypothetical protein
LFVSIRFILIQSPERAFWIFVKVGAHHKTQLQLRYFEGNKKKNLFDVTVGWFVSGRIDAIGLPNIVVLTVI